MLFNRTISIETIEKMQIHKPEERKLNENMINIFVSSA